MNKILLGIATMEAGLSMPGSSLPLLLKTISPAVHEIIVIDGKLTQQAKDLYTTIQLTAPNITYYSSPWTGSLKAQYDLVLASLNYGDWWVMLDDDEHPSTGLLLLLAKAKKNLDSGKPAFDSALPSSILSIATPRVTYFTRSYDQYDPWMKKNVNFDTYTKLRDNIIPTQKRTFYAGELVPESPNQITANSPYARPRAHIFCIDPSMRFMASPAGRHVVPYYTRPDSSCSIINSQIYHKHYKAPELYVYNDCVKALFDDDIKDPNISKEYRKALADNDISDGESFLTNTTADIKLTDSFYDFCIKYKDHGAPQGRLFIWYFNICHPEKNPFPQQDWTQSLKLVLNNNWRETYIKNEINGSLLDQAYLSYYPTGYGQITL